MSSQVIHKDYYRDQFPELQFFMRGPFPGFGERHPVLYKAGVSLSLFAVVGVFFSLYIFLAESILVALSFATPAELDWREESSVVEMGNILAFCVFALLAAILSMAFLITKVWTALDKRLVSKVSQYPELQNRELALDVVERSHSIKVFIDPDIIRRAEESGISKDDALEKVELSLKALQDTAMRISKYLISSTPKVISEGYSGLLGDSSSDLPAKIQKLNESISTVPDRIDHLIEKHATQAHRERLEEKLKLAAEKAQADANYYVNQKELGHEQ